MVQLYLFGLAAALISIIFKNKKCAFVSVVILFLLLTGVRTGNDITNYFNWYSRLETYSASGIMDEWLFSFIGVFIKSFGADFYLFKAILTFICMFILFHVLKHYTNNWGFILFHYYMYLIFIDCQQFRNFLALTILIIAIDLLVRHRNKIGFIISNLLAVGFHTAFAFYFLFIFIFEKISKKWIKVLGVSVTIFVLVCIYNRDWLNVMELFSSLYEDSRNRLVTYLSRRTNWGFLPPMIYHFFSIYLFFREKKILKMHWHDKVEIPKWELKGTILRKTKIEYPINKIIEFTLYANILVILIIPFSMLSLPFYRIIRNMYFISLISYSIISTELKDNISEKILFNLAVILLTLGWLIYDAVFYYSFEETFDLIFNGTFFWIQEI